MKKIRILAIALAVFGLVSGWWCNSGATPYTDFNFDDIIYWVGEGENRAALVIDWWDGKAPESLAWGYRWDGDATGVNMLAAIAGSGFGGYGGPYSGDLEGDDTRLYAVLEYYDMFDAYIVYGFGYDLDNDGSIGFGDHFHEGWLDGYWSYWLSDGDSAWGYSGVGISGRELADGSWDGWSFSDDAVFGSGGPPRTPVGAPVPVPAAVWLLGSGLIGLIGLRRKR